jgi:hypothetical protein
MKTLRILSFLLLSVFCITAAGGSFAGEKQPPTLFPAMKDGKWGYIDSKGNTAIQFQFKGAMPFSEGLAIVSTDSSEKPYACIDTAGNVVFYLNPEWEYMNQFSEGLASLKDSKADKYGYVDTKGNVAIPFQFSSAADFSEGLASVELYGASGLTFGFINTKGKFVISADANMKFSFSDGLASVLVRDANNMPFFGYIDFSGKLVIQPKYKKAGKFSEGLAFVWDGEKLEMIDKSGAAVAALPYKVGEYDSMPVFSCGFAAPPIGWRPKDQKEWGFIDKKGQLAFKDLGIWSIRTVFSEGLAWVYFRETGEGACIDTSGKVLFKVAQFDDAKEFSGGVAAVKIKGQPGFCYYDSTGNVIWK